MDERTELLRQMRHEIVHLTESPLYEFRIENNYFPVIGQGSHFAHIMFIGEAPGENEAKTGRPFCGQSGRILDELLDRINLNRDDVYVTNIVKDRPPKNRDPSKAEIKLYAPYLKRQIEIIQPRVLATLGRFSMEFVLDLFDAGQKGQKISALHGQTIAVDTAYGEATVVPLYHPAVALYNANQKATLIEDFKALKPFLD
ncbi:MAG: uracil-DNA glycosylase [Anaerolineae bacterium]|nr:uracil-DNA glycosylase [Anaerolineae bacterium]